MLKVSSDDGKVKDTFNTNTSIKTSQKLETASDKKANMIAQNGLPQAEDGLSQLKNTSMWSLLKNTETDDEGLIEIDPDSESSGGDNKEELTDGSDYDSEVFYDVEEFSPDEQQLEEGEINLNVPTAKKAEIAPKSQKTAPKTVETASKTEEASKSLWERTTGALASGFSYGAKTIASIPIKLVTSIFSLFTNKAQLVEQAKQKMMNELNDPMYVSFTEMIGNLAWSAIDPKLSKKPTNFIEENLFPHKELIKEIIEINLAKGFANLAKKIKANRHNINNFDNQPTLVSMASLLFQRSAQYINAQKLIDIEQIYRPLRLEIQNSAKEFFRDIPNHQELINKYIRSSNPEEQEAIIGTLFPNNVIDRKEKIVYFTDKLNQMKNHERELRIVFDKVADAILTELFPNKVKDLVFPGETIVKRFPLLPNYIYDNFMKDILTDLLLTSYLPLENNTVRNEAWESRLKMTIGKQDLSPLIQSPAALLLGITTNYIQSNPGAVGTVAEFLGSLMDPSQNKAVVSPALEMTEEEKENVKKEEHLSHLSQEQLANWCIESIQAMLHTKDPNLLSFGLFIKQVFNNLTLALMANGTALVIPEDERIDENQFLKVLTDRIYEKVTSINGKEAIKNEFWKSFVEQLPLSPLIQDNLIPILVNKTKDLQEAFIASDSDSPENAPNHPPQGVSENVQRNTEEIIREYKGGEQILSIVETVSNQIVEEILSDNINLVDEYDLGDTIENLVDEYLPGISINDNLKSWFKSNVSSLSTSEDGNSPKWIISLKSGIQSILRQAIITTIKTNFSNDSDAFTAQLLTNIRGAFATALENYDESTRDHILAGQAIQAKIRKKEAKIEQLKKSRHEETANLSGEQKTLLENLKTTRLRCLRAKNYVTSLKSSLEENLNKFNNTLPDAPWDKDDLQYVNSALTLRKTNLTKISTPEERQEFIKSLERENEYLSLENDAESANKLATNRTLIKLLAMSSEQLSLVVQLLNIEATIKHAENEKQLLDARLTEVNKELEDYDSKAMDNRADWERAIETYALELQKRKNIDQLSKEITALNNELEPYLVVFQNLSQELAGLLGLDQKEKLDLVPSLRDQIWPYIESAKKTQIARLLFTHITPLMLPIFDINLNRAKLKELVGGDDFLIHLCETAAQELFARIPDYITSYRPFAEKILVLINNRQPSKEEATRMEKSLHDTMTGLGREGLTASMLQPILVESKKNETEMEKIEAHAKAEIMSSALEQHAKTAGFKEFSPEQVLEVLLPYNLHETKKETLKLQKKAQILAKDLNQFLLNRGKAKITVNGLIFAYSKQINGTQVAISETNSAQKIKALQDAHVVEKIKDVAITPEEIAQTLNDVIPGAKDLHTLVAPELQAVIVGQDEAFLQNRGTMQKYAEGMMLRAFLIIAKANRTQGQDILTTLTEKLKNLELSAAELQGKTDEEIAHYMIDKVIKDIVGIVNKDDFRGIPLPLQEMAYKKLKELSYQHATPLLMPIIERKKTRAALDQLSGSPFLGSLSEAISKDIFDLAPVLVSSYKPIIGKAYELIFAKQATSDQINLMAEEIAELVKNSNKVKLTNKAILAVLVKNADAADVAVDLKSLKDKLKEHDIKKEINNVVITPEEIVAGIKESLLPQMPPYLQLTLTQEIQNFIHNKPDAYKNVAEFAQEYVEGILLNIFTGMANKNPPTENNDQTRDKDSMLVATEKLLDIAARKYQTMGNVPFETFAEDVEKEIMESVFGIDSPEAFKGLPPALQTKVYDSIKDKLAGKLIRLQQSMKRLEMGSEEVKAARAGLRDPKFGPLVKKPKETDALSKAKGEILIEDIASYVISMMPGLLTEATGQDLKLVNVISKGLENYLEELARGNIELAKVLLNYAQAPKYQQLLGESLINVAGSQHSIENKQKAVEMISNLIAVPLNRILQNAVQIEEKRGEELDRKLVQNVLEVVRGHLQNVNLAKDIALAAGRSQMKHADFIAAAGDGLDPAVPVLAVDYQKTIDRIYAGINTDHLDASQLESWYSKKNDMRIAIKGLMKRENKGIKNITLNNVVAHISVIYNKATGLSLDRETLVNLAQPDEEGLTLKNIIRKEAEALSQQRDKGANIPGALVLLKTLYPKGKDDLTFLPEEFRGTAWKQFKTLFPTALPILIDTVFDPATLNKLALGSLESVRDSLDQDIKITSGDAPIQAAPLDPIDMLMGDIMVELLKNIKLPDLIKNQIVDPDKGISDAMKQSMGAALRAQFNGMFIRELLPKALDGMVKRDPKTGDYALKFDARSKAEKEADAPKVKKKMEKDLRRASRQVVDSAISNFFRTKWAQFQHKFDKLVEKMFGKIGSNSKWALDHIFRFVFFTIVGTMLSVLLWPLKRLIKEIIYRVASLDFNVNSVLDLFRTVPTDQPLDEAHGIYNDDMVYKLAQAIYKTLNEEIVQEAQNQEAEQVKE